MKNLLVDGFLKYTSVTENPEEVAVELDRLIDLEFGVLTDHKVALERFPDGSVSKLALILKPNADGSTKRRIIAAASIPKQRYLSARCFRV